MGAVTKINQPRASSRSVGGGDQVAPHSEQAKAICVVGLGYIGLPAASLLANRGFQVHGVDINEETVRTINAGGIHIQEPELDVMVSSAVHSGNLTAAIAPAPAEVFILAVPTPFTAGCQPDLSYVEAASRSIAPVLKQGDLVILESTSPVGTTEKVARWLAEERPDLARGKSQNGRNGCPGIHVAHCPERVLPGQIMKELVENDRVVGGIDDASTEAAIEFYRNFVTGEILATDSRTAEMCKLAENTFRDINIAYANELSIICDKLEMDVWELIRLANHHPRVNILQPGAGVGGHCIAVDPWFIVAQAPEQARLIRTAREVNDYKPEYVVEQIKRRLNGRRTVACLGLAFKPDIDDLRESPALKIVEMLAEDDTLQVLAVEPHIDQLPDSLIKSGNVSLVSLEFALLKADTVAALVKHRKIKHQLEHDWAGSANLLDFVQILE